MILVSAENTTTNIRHVSN